MRRAAGLGGKLGCGVFFLGMTIVGLFPIGCNSGEPERWEPMRAGNSQITDWQAVALGLFEGIVWLYDAGFCTAEDALQECVDLRYHGRGCPQHLQQEIDIFCAELRGDMGHRAMAG